MLKKAYEEMQHLYFILQMQLSSICISIIGIPSTYWKV